MKARVLTVSGELLTELLYLPEGSKIECIIPDHTRPGDIVCRVTNEQFEDITQGRKFPICCPIYQRKEDGSVEFIDWGLRE